MNAMLAGPPRMAAVVLGLLAGLWPVAAAVVDGDPVPVPRGPEAISLLGQPLVPPAPPPDRLRALEGDLARATADFIRAPDDADTIIWLGRRLGYLGRYRDAIDVYTRGLRLHPHDIRLWRHRGHRNITVRAFDRAIADLQAAARLIRERRIPDAVEPDGAPNALNIPTSTSHFNVFYHLGLAHFLKGEFPAALAAYRECMTYSVGSDDRLVATSDWLYMTLRRLGRDAEAAAVLGPIHPRMKIIEDHAYWHRLLLYKGEKTADELLAPNADPVAVATYGYGVGHWHLVNGRPAEARAVFQRVVAGPEWAAFGFIAAEAELARRR